jgi:signal transduction histidine kinase/CheY-like chemotaxis protein
MNDTIISMINECFEYSIIEKNISEIMKFNLIKINELIKFNHGFIGEKNVSDDDKVFIRYYGLITNNDDLDHQYNKNGYIDFYPEDITMVDKQDFHYFSKFVYTNDNHELNNLHLFPLKNKDSIVGIIGFSNDEKYTDDIIKQLTPFTKFVGNVLINIRNTENLEKHKMSFIANMSHEVRTPLNAIITTLDLMSKTELSPQQFMQFETIKTCSTQLMEIVNDILDYSKILTNGLKIKLAPTSLNKCVQNVYNILIQKAIEKDIILEYFIDKDVPDMIIGDSTRINQALLNILSNGIKFTKAGSVTLLISVIKTDYMQCELLFKITDTGIGIPSGKINKVFDAFRQIDNDYLSDICGVGLGLPITKYIAELFNGSIEISSRINVGTEVSLNMKFKVYQNIVDIDKLKLYYTNKNILLLDSDIAESKFLYSYLAEMNIKPILSSCIDEAMLYLSNDIFIFEFLLININTVSDSDISKIYRLKNSTVKIIIVDLDDKDKRNINYDYKILRPINTHKINEFLNLVYIGSLYQSKNNHNEVLINKKIHKISNVNMSIQEVSTPKKFNILVAEDNKQNQIVMVSILNLLGYSDIVIANDGLEAYSELAEKDYDIAFIDLKMPGISGIDVTIKFKQKYPEKNTFIIAVTASLSEEIKKRCFDSKMDGFITKPIDKDDIKTIINLIIDNKMHR